MRTVPPWLSCLAIAAALCCPGAVTAQDEWPHNSTDWQDPLFQARVQGVYDWIGSGPGRLVLFEYLTQDGGFITREPMEVYRLSTVNRDLESFPPRTGINPDREYFSPPKDWVDRRYLVEYFSENDAVQEGFFEDRLTEEASADTYYLMGNIFYLQRNFPAAIQNYQKAIAGFPRFRFAHKNMAYAYASLGDCGNALPAALKATEYGALTPRLKGVEGYCSLQRGDFNRAAEAFAMARMLDGKNGIWTSLQVQALIGLGRFDHAGQLLEGRLGKSGLGPESLDQLISIFRTENDRDNTLALLEIKRRAGLISEPEEQELYRLKIDKGLSSMLTEAELMDYLAEAEGSPDRLVGILDSMRYSNAMRSSEFIDAVTDQKPEGISLIEQTNLDMAKANLLWVTGRLDDALATLGSVLRGRPTHCEALLLSAKVLDAQGETGISDAYLTRAENNPGNCRNNVLAGRAEILLSRGEYVQALDLYEQDSRRQYINGQIENPRAREMKRALADLVGLITQ